MIHVGTSGYGYRDWVPAFYPPELAEEDHLAYYAERFSCCELTFTCYRMPEPGELERLLQRSAGRLIFTVRAHRCLTHERDMDIALARRFADSLSPLTEAGKLGALLAPFPASFVNDPAHRAYVCRLQAVLELPVVAEFQNDSWFDEETLEFLRGWGIGFSCTDAPEAAGFTRPRALATSDVGYARFHGRNASRWWAGDGAVRFDYSYAHRELLAWVPRLKEIARHTKVTFAVFHNHWRGQAAANGLALQEILSKSRTSAAAKRAGAARAG
jgi:uncharacterized protein YecE (DUF72 family)